MSIAECISRSVSIKPCPFCGHTECAPEPHFSEEGNDCTVICSRCLAEGPFIMDEESVETDLSADAIRFWNQRPTISPPINETELAAIKEAAETLRSLINGTVKQEMISFYLANVNTLEKFARLSASSSG